VPVASLLEVPRAVRATARDTASPLRTGEGTLPRNSGMPSKHAHRARRIRTGLHRVPRYSLPAAYYIVYCLCMTEPETDLYAVAFFLADHAVVENGKVYTNGAFWNRQALPSFPAVSTFSVVAVLHVPWRAYHQTHKFTVWFEDADARRIAGQLDGEFQVGAAPEMKVGDPTIMPFAATVANFTLERAGDFAAVLAVDGTEIARWSFRATQVFGGAEPSAGSANFGSQGERG
jgi:hypothetical protein